MKQARLKRPTTEATSALTLARTRYLECRPALGELLDVDRARGCLAVVAAAAGGRAGSQAAARLCCSAVTLGLCWIYAIIWRLDITLWSRMCTGERCGLYTVISDYYHETTLSPKKSALALCVHVCVYVCSCLCARVRARLRAYALACVLDTMDREGAGKHRMMVRPITPGAGGANSSSTTGLRGPGGQGGGRLGEGPGGEKLLVGGPGTTKQDREPQEYAWPFCLTASRVAGPLSLHSRTQYGLLGLPLWV